MANIILLGIVSLLTDISSEMIYPLIPLYLTSARIGATPAIVGLVEASQRAWQVSSAFYPATGPTGRANVNR